MRDFAGVWGDVEKLTGLPAIFDGVLVMLPPVFAAPEVYVASAKYCRKLSASSSKKYRQRFALIDVDCRDSDRPETCLAVTSEGHGFFKGAGGDRDRGYEQVCTKALFSRPLLDLSDGSSKKMYEGWVDDSGPANG